MSLYENVLSLGEIRLRSSSVFKWSHRRLSRNSLRLSTSPLSLSLQANATSTSAESLSFVVCLLSSVYTLAAKMTTEDKGGMTVSEGQDRGAALSEANRDLFK